MNTLRLGAHEGAIRRLAESIIPSPGRVTLAQARLLAERAHDRYRQTLQAQFRGQVGIWETLLDRIAWMQAESRVVDLRIAEGRREEIMGVDGRKEAHHEGPRVRGPGRRWTA